MVFRLLRLYWRETCNIRTLAFLVLMLLLSALLFGDLPVGKEGGSSNLYNPVRLSVVDEDNSLISYTLVDQFASLSIVDKVYVESLDEARQRLDANEILLIMVIPAGFYEQTTQGLERNSLTVYLNERMPAESVIFVRMLGNATGSVESIQSALFAFQDALRPLFTDDAAFASAADAAAVNMAFKLVGRKSILKINEEAKLNTAYYVVSALTCLLAMLTSLLVLLQLQQERRSGQHERLLLANVPWWQLMLAKQLIGLVWLAAGFAPILAGIFRYYPKAERWPVLLAVTLLYWITSALCLILGYLGRTSETLLLAVWLGLLGLLLIGGCIYPIQLLPDWLQRISILSPARWSFMLIYNALAGLEIRPQAIAALAVMVPVTAAGSWLAWRQARPGT